MLELTFREKLGTGKVVNLLYGTIRYLSRGRGWKSRVAKRDRVEI